MEKVATVREQGGVYSMFNVWTSSGPFRKQRAIVLGRHEWILLLPSGTFREEIVFHMIPQNLVEQDDGVQVNR